MGWFSGRSTAQAPVAASGSQSGRRVATSPQPRTLLPLAEPPTPRPLPPINLIRQISHIKGILGMNHVFISSESREETIKKARETFGLLLQRGIGVNLGGVTISTENIEKTSARMYRIGESTFIDNPPNGKIWEILADLVQLLPFNYLSQPRRVLVEEHRCEVLPIWLGEDPEPQTTIYVASQERVSNPVIAFGGRYTPKATEVLLSIDYSDVTDAKHLVHSTFYRVAELVKDRLSSKDITIIASTVSLIGLTKKMENPLLTAKELENSSSPQGIGVIVDTIRGAFNFESLLASMILLATIYPQETPGIIRVISRDNNQELVDGLNRVFQIAVNIINFQANNNNQIEIIED